MGDGCGGASAPPLTLFLAALGQLAQLVSEDKIYIFHGKYFFFKFFLQVILKKHHYIAVCGEPAISLHSHHVSLVQWTNPLLPVTRDLG